MKEGFIKDAYELIIKEIQTLLSVLYLLMIGIGMLFNHYKYAEFGINIFQYADIFDFLIAPFEDGRIVIASILSLVIPFIVIVGDTILKRKKPRFYSKMNFGWDKKSWYDNFRLFSFGFLILFSLFEVAIGYGRDVKRSIHQQDNITIIFADKTTKEGQMIGKTKEVLFLLNKEKVSIIQLSSLVKEIEMQ